MNMIITLQLLMITLCYGINTVRFTKKSNVVPPVTMQYNHMLATQVKASEWINSFKKCRDAVVKKDLKAVKSFIDFPIMNENNEIWYLAYGNDDKAIATLGSEIKPFTEVDFDKYHKKLFTKAFAAGMLKIKTAELAKNTKYTTVTMKEGKDLYKIVAEVDTKENILVLNITYNASSDAEHNVIYYFKITDTNNIKFMQVRIAG